MRLLVLVLTLLAGFKVWATNHTYRQAAESVIVAAYRERAIAACQRDAHEAGTAAAAAPGAKTGPAPASVPSWARPASIRLVIGKPGVDGGMLALDGDRPPPAYLMLQAAAGASCEYDISANHAALVRG